MNARADVCGKAWLEAMLQRHRHCRFLSHFGCPETLAGFRDNIPLADYDQLRPWLEQLFRGDDSVLFPGRPVGYERTGGSSGGAKLIPYTRAGLNDFRSALSPWLTGLLRRHHITGSAYFSISPACRKPASLAGIPIGLCDADYLGEEGKLLLTLSAVPPEVATIPDYQQWRQSTLDHLRRAKNLELLSAWSPTFLLRLFEGEDTQTIWPALKVISCWADAASAAYIPALQAMFPHACIEPKGLMSTEAVVTVPDDEGRPLLCEYNFFEFRNGDGLFLPHELSVGSAYEVIVTTASGLYRYCTGDMVVHEGVNASGRPILRFIGREGLVSDLVGEKLNERFVAGCLKGVPGASMLVPAAAGDGYILVSDRQIDVAGIDAALAANPQYAYARQMRQLRPLRHLIVGNLWDIYLRQQLASGVRLGDIKPVALDTGTHWEQLFGGAS